MVFWKYLKVVYSFFFSDFKLWPSSAYTRWPKSKSSSASPFSSYCPCCWTPKKKSKKRTRVKTVSSGGSSSSSGSSLSKTAQIIIGVVVSLIALGFIMYCCYACCRSTKRQDNTETVTSPENHQHQASRENEPFIPTKPTTPPAPGDGISPSQGNTGEISHKSIHPLGDSAPYPPSGDTYSPYPPLGDTSTPYPPPGDTSNPYPPPGDTNALKNLPAGEITTDLVTVDANAAYPPPWATSTPYPFLKENNSPYPSLVLTDPSSYPRPGNIATAITPPQGTQTATNVSNSTSADDAASSDPHPPPPSYYDAVKEGRGGE